MVIGFAVVVVLFVTAALAAAVTWRKLRKQEALIETLREELLRRDQLPKPELVAGKVVDEEELRRECGKLASRYRRHDEGFSVVVMEVHPASHPADPLPEILAVHAAQVLAGTTRHEDTICRLDDTTFAALLTRTNYEDGLKFVERARERLSSQAGRTPDGPAYVSMIAGVCEWRRTMPSLDRALERAAIEMEKERIALEENQRKWAAG